MENSSFIYSYSASENNEIEKIRKKYLPKEESKLDTIRKMDSRIKMAGILQSLCIGIIGCLIFGIGMCFGLDVFGGADWLTLLFCFIGIISMLPAYPIYKYFAKKTRDALAPKILKLSEEVLNGQN